MKNILKLGLVLFFVSCSSIKDDKNLIPYVLDISVEKAIYKEVAKKSNDVIIVFYFEHLSDSTLKIHIIDSVDKELLVTNRRLFINDKFYPIIFDTDYLFFSEIKDGNPIVSFEESKNYYKKIVIPSIQQRGKNPELYGYTRKTIIVDDSIYWIIDNKGKLVKSTSD